MRSTITDTMLVVLVISSVGVNIMQRREIRNLRVRDSVVEPGSRAEPIVARDLNGQSAQIDQAGELPMVLYVFSPQCGWCERNWPSLRALAGQLRGRYRVVGLSLANRGLAEVVGKKQLAFPVYGSPSRETVAAYKLESTPQTIAVSRDGHIERVWKGAYDGTVQTDIERYFDVRLPDLSN